MKSVSESARAARRCRVFRSRMVSTITRAVASWSTLFGVAAPLFNPPRDSCTAVQKSAKEFLGSCPSAVEEERMAFQSIKKLLPDSCRCMEKTLLTGVADGLQGSPCLLPPGYIRFCRTVTSRLFPKGWDAGTYEDECLTCSPSLSGTTDSCRRDGGSLGTDIDHHSFLEVVLGQVPFEFDQPEAQLIVVQSAGKPRPLTKFSSESLVLKPLHKSIYNRLSRFRWLCRGDLDDSKMKKAGFSKKEGEVLVSGDYKGATDNLPIEVAEAILDELLANAVSVPKDVKRYASAILRPFVWNLEADLSFVPTVGQMMGSYLSFPLLCLQNYTAFSWSAKLEGLKVKDVPLLINGDDILFQSRPSFAPRWMSTVQQLGLEVERTKTSVDAEFGSLNSTLVRWAGVDLRVIPTFRFGMLRRADDFSSLSETFQSFLRGRKSSLRFRAAREFFRWHLPTLRSTRLTLVEMGFRGLLAWRMGVLFDFPAHRTQFKVPALPKKHNVIFSSEKVTFVSEESLSDELKKMNGREMAAWKFGISWRFVESEYTSRCIRRAIALSEIRGSRGPCFKEMKAPGFGVRVSPLTRKEWQGLFLVKKERAVESYPLFSDILSLQRLEDYDEDPPPPYVMAEADDVVGESLSRKTK
ncbi:RNA dependent RNA polymerase [Plasmopara viticola lesion associated ourmia-like virus 73]|uniref:RNA dependent RNA polymerase n=1 Tax=Plasmopara viticola lesion associated ourmia-like virus 73 TaxID=2686546 RepID=A0ABX6FJ54_9VIRU|nr:RNA dependent RNA polymerase [Plasmopara viticola lesion associated ourmia-like virus 73]QGY72603.1 RNA dependent RNA polymerase [Plasmopara viticola lesion associated ourmia-like virus 73]